MITLHHLEYSQSFRILWLLEELGVDYQLEKYARDPETHLAPAKYKAISPLGSAPVITDGNVTLAESSAIIDYVLDKHPNDVLRPPPGHPHRTRYLFWFHAAQGSLMPLMLIDTLFRIVGERAPFFLKPIVRALSRQVTAAFIRPRLDALLTTAEADLAAEPWFGGAALTAADIVISYPLESANTRGYLTDAHPNCRAWLERVHQHPSFQSAKKKDGKPSMVLAL